MEGFGQPVGGHAIHMTTGPIVLPRQLFANYPLHCVFD